MDSGPGDMKT
jgi:hypothetical protein